MERFILKKLLDWKNSPYRKPLILKGVRQVGKTWILKEFGRRCYANTAQQELNSTQILHIAWFFSFFKPARYSSFYTMFAPKNWSQRKGARTMTKFTRAELRNIFGVACTEDIENRLVALHTDCCHSQA